MQKYLVIYTQDGEGCGYTIGCGTHTEYVSLESPDLYKILSIAADKVLGDGGMEHEECRIASVRIVPAQHVVNLDLDSLRAVKARRQQEQVATDDEQRELAELARLKAKYG